MKPITAIVLSFNEEKHITRCINNLFKVVSKVYVVDSFSNDATPILAKNAGAIVLQHEYVNQAAQFQWALDNCAIDTEWVMRLDADEYLSDALIEEIQLKIPSLDQSVTGVSLPFSVIFLGKVLRFGKLRPTKVLRIWRKGSVFMEQRWMDERLVLKRGTEICFKNKFYDHNLKGLDSWIQKHNSYSNREIIVELNRHYSFLNSASDHSHRRRDRSKSFYYSLPRFFRAFCYFFIRYILYLGFLDGIRGLIWLTLQAYWYRFLVDCKLYEIEFYLGRHPTNDQLVNYFSDLYHIDLSQLRNPKQKD